jgi:rhodanese-related sulfurtransferase
MRLRPSVPSLALAGLVATLALSSVSARAEESEPFKRLTVDEVQQLLAQKDVAVFDNNGDERYAAGHVPGAKHLSIVDIKAADLPANKDATLVFYCGNEHCGACHQGAKKAIELGYRKVFIMPAGIAGWEKAGKPVEKAKA